MYFFYHKKQVDRYGFEHVKGLLRALSKILIFQPTKMTSFF